MVRTARGKSGSGIYHVMLRGINRQIIFDKDKDRERFLETISSYKEMCKYKIYAYCLMDNHAHLLMQETSELIGQSLQRICGSYVFWYNRDKDRVGHLFQERFKSEIVDNDAYFLTVLRYIHQNPLKAGLVNKIEQYHWSSYHNYIGKCGFVDTDFALEMFSNDRAQSIEQFKGFINQTNEDKCLDYEERKRLLDNEINEYLIQHGIRNISSLQQMEKDDRNAVIREMKSIDGVTIRQLSRVTGISKSVIDRA